jgi:hypothetical protein
MPSSHEALAHSLRRFVFEKQSDVSVFTLAAVELDVRSSAIAADTVVDRVAHLRERDIERLFRLLAETPNQFFGTMTAGEIRCALRELVDEDCGVMTAA